MHRAPTDEVSHLKLSRYMASNGVGTRHLGALSSQNFLGVCILLQNT